MKEESQSKITRSVLNVEQGSALVMWLKGQGDLTGKQHAHVARDARLALSIPVTVANLRHWARGFNVPLKEPAKVKLPLADRVALNTEGLVKHAETIQVLAIGQAQHDVVDAFLARELLRVQLFIASLGIELNGEGLVVSDELRVMAEDRLMTKDTLFETGPTKTSDESAAL